MRRLPEEQHVDDAGSQSAQFVFRSDFANADEICIVDRAAGRWVRLVGVRLMESSAVLGNTARRTLATNARFIARS